MAGDLLRVVTMNVLGPANPDWERRRALLAATLPALDADVVALQEVDVRDGAAAVVDLLGPGWHVTPFSGSAEDGIGGALATRAPHRVLVEVDQRIGAPGEDLAWSATLVVEVTSALGRLLVAHHKPSWPLGAEAERERQAVRAARALEALVADEPAEVVVLGDMDAGPEAASMRFWTGLAAADGMSVCYLDAWDLARPGEPGHTFSPANPLVRAGEMPTAPGRRIDHVLVRSGTHGPGLRVTRCELVLEGAVDGVRASDHFGVLADLERPDHPPGTWSDALRPGDVDASGPEGDRPL